MPRVSMMFGSEGYAFDYIGTPMTWTCGDCGYKWVDSPPKAGWVYDPEYAGIDGSGWDWYSEVEVDDIATYMIIDSRKDHYHECFGDNCTCNNKGTGHYAAGHDDDCRR